MDFGAYELDPAVYDEMFGPDGAPRKHSYLSEDPILANVPTHICRRPEQLEYTLDNLDRLIVKRVGESGGYGMLVGPQATPAEREAYAREMRADPADFISQPLLALSRAPCFVDGRAEPRHVDLRPFVLRGRQTRLVPGAFCRVALRRGSIVVNSSQGGGGKDVWVLEDRMLARNAEGLYWTGRYVERTSHLCRLLGEQMETLVDRPIREIDFGWRRIYSALRRQPPGPAIGFGGLDDDFTLADSFALADDLTFERSNPDSVWNCFASGRENARQMRHCITGEMWTCLNLAYLRLRELNINDIWKTAPESFYTAVSRDVDTFLGVAERTMYRDDRWRFLQIGRCTERVQLAVSLLLAHVEAITSAEETSDHDWMSLLRVCNALDAYTDRYGVAIRADRVFDLLVIDPRLPRSLYRASDAAAGELAALAPGPGPTGEAARLAAQMTETVCGRWPSEGADLDDRRDRLRQLETQCRGFHDLVMAAHVQFDVDDRVP